MNEGTVSENESGGDICHKKSKTVRKVSNALQAAVTIPLATQKYVLHALCYALASDFAVWYVTAAGRLV